MSRLIRWEPTRWDPFNELGEIGERFNRLFGGLQTRPNGGREALTVADWHPTVDITEDEKEFLVKAELPEVDRKDVKVTVEDGLLSIRGERKQEKEEKGKKFHRVERSYGTFVRSFMLPENVVEDKLQAEFKDGMLLVHLPKGEKPKAKTVEVKVA
jgi:HSP20 family protein